MSWINKHWDADYQQRAQQIVKTVVGVPPFCYFCFLTVLQLAEYRSKVVPPAVAAPLQAGEKWQNLDDQYGLDDMFDEPSAPAQIQSLEEEYGSYIHAPLSVKGTNLLQYWQVCSICEVLFSYLLWL